MTVFAAARPPQRPMHGVPLVEAGAKHDQHVRRVAENGGGSMAGAGIAEDAERQFVIFGEHALGAQRRRDRNRPAFRSSLQRRGGFIVLDTGAGKKCDLWSGRPTSRSKHRFGGGPAQRRDPLEIIGDRSCNPLAHSPVITSCVSDKCTGPCGCAHIAVSACRNQ